MKTVTKLDIIGTTKSNDESNPLPNYKFLKTIGEGTFGIVHLGLHIQTGENVAIKILEKEKIQEVEDVERINREIKYLKKFKNINIIKIYEVIETEKRIYIIMEHASGGELFNYIVEKKKLSALEASFFFVQIIHALDFIHKHNIAHRDIKPENMLLTENKTLKLIDFGLSNQYNKGIFLKTPCGSPCYAAPEMILGRKYKGSAIDIWSSGITLFAMVCGYLPFEDPNNDKLYKKILDCKLEFAPNTDDAARDLIKKLLTVNPEKRITFDEIKQHPFLKIGNSVINKNSFGLYLNKIDNFVIKKMMELGYSKDKVIKEVESSNHNNITTTYELLLNKYNCLGGIMKKDNNQIREQLNIEKIKVVDESPIKINHGIDNSKAIENSFNPKNEKNESKPKIKNLNKQTKKNVRNMIFEFESEKKKYILE